MKASNIYDTHTIWSSYAYHIHVLYIQYAYRIHTRSVYTLYAHRIRTIYILYIYIHAIYTYTMHIVCISHTSHTHLVARVTMARAAVTRHEISSLQFVFIRSALSHYLHKRCAPLSRPIVGTPTPHTNACATTPTPATPYSARKRIHEYINTNHTNIMHADHEHMSQIQVRVHTQCAFNPPPPSPVMSQLHYDQYFVAGHEWLDRHKPIAATLSRP